MFQVNVSDPSHNYVKNSSEAGTTSETGITSEAEATLTSSKSKKEH
jgi:hypothetical protein